MQARVTERVEDAAAFALASPYPSIRSNSPPTFTPEEMTMTDHDYHDHH